MSCCCKNIKKRKENEKKERVLLGELVYIHIFCRFLAIHDNTLRVATNDKGNDHIILFTHCYTAISASIHSLSLKRTIMMEKSDER